jgi:integrase/recombinase XerD
MIDNSIQNDNRGGQELIYPNGKNDDFINKNATNPIEIVKPQRGDDLPIYFTNEELDLFFSVIPPKSMRDKVFFLTLLGTGQRVSEILKLRKKDIDLENRIMRMVRLKKRKKSVCTIRLHKDVAYWISIYIGSLKAEDLIFDFSRQYADYLCKTYSQLAGTIYKRTSCHIFRHTFAVRWLEQGKPIHKLKEHLGHSHINTTMVYLRIVNQDLFDTVDSLDIMGFVR